MNKEGELNAAHRAWHESNGTYTFSHGLGIVIILIGVLIALHPVLPQVALSGVSCSFYGVHTLSFLATTRRRGCRLWEIRHTVFHTCPVRKTHREDCIMLGAAVTTMADSAGQYLYQLPACTKK